MKKILVIIVLTSIGISSIYAQKKHNVKPRKVLYEYFPYSRKIELEYEADAATGAKNGYSKKYSSDGLLVETNQYKMGILNGTQTVYDDAGTGQIWSTVQYLDGQKNGIYNQWCFENTITRRRYLCNHSIYKNGTLISRVFYYPNGGKQEEQTKDSEKTWLEDGLPTENGLPITETKKGKIFHNILASESGVNYGKVTDYIEFDSLDIHYRYQYKYKLGNIDNTRVLKDNFLEWVGLIDITTKGDKVNSIYEYKYDDANIEYLGNKLPEIKAVSIARTKNDSVSIKLGYELFNLDPNIDVRIKLYKKKTIEFPKSWIVWSIYGDGLLRKGNINNAIIAYKKSLELNTNNNELIDKLKKLQKN